MVSLPYSFRIYNFYFTDGLVGIQEADFSVYRYTIQFALLYLNDESELNWKAYKDLYTTAEQIGKTCTEYQCDCNQSKYRIQCKNKGNLANSHTFGFLMNLSDCEV